MRVAFSAAMDGGQRARCCKGLGARAHQPARIGRRAAVRPVAEADRAGRRATMPTTVRLALPSAFMTNWVRNHYADRLLLEFRAFLPMCAASSIETRCRRQPARCCTIVRRAPSADAAPSAARRRPPSARALDPRFTFDRFVVDASNRVAFNAARALAEPGAPRFSPLYLHSGTGQGKTHLMHAIGQAFLGGRARCDRALHAGRALHVRIRRGDARARHARVQGAAALRRPADDRRPAVHRRQGCDAGGVLPHGQRVHGRRASGW